MQENKYDHIVFNNDPVKFLFLKDKYVEVTTKKGSPLRGFVKAIDPVSESVLLSICSDGTYKTTLIMGENVKNIQEQEPPAGEEPLPQESAEAPINIAELEERKVQIVNWLRKNFLPVHDNGETIDVNNGLLKIAPPYGIEDCLSTNTIILSRIQHLIQNIPLEH